MSKRWLCDTSYARCVEVGLPAALRRRKHTLFADTADAKPAIAENSSNVHGNRSATEWKFMTATDVTFSCVLSLGVRAARPLYCVVGCGCTRSTCVPVAPVERMSAGEKKEHRIVASPSPFKADTWRTTGSLTRPCVPFIDNPFSIRYVLHKKNVYVSREKNTLRPARSGLRIFASYTRTISISYTMCFWAEKHKDVLLLKYVDVTSEIDALNAYRKTGVRIEFYEFRNVRMSIGKYIFNLVLDFQLLNIPTFFCNEIDYRLENDY